MGFQHPVWLRAVSLDFHRNTGARRIKMVMVRDVICPVFFGHKILVCGCKGFHCRRRYLDLPVAKSIKPIVFLAHFHSQLKRCGATITLLLQTASAALMAKIAFSWSYF